MRGGNRGLTEGMGDIWFYAHGARAIVEVTLSAPTADTTAHDTSAPSATLPAPRALVGLFMSRVSIGSDDQTACAHSLERFFR